MPLFHIFSGAEWIAQLGRCGLITPSYIPSAEMTQLRLLTRRLHSYKQGQTQIKNEIHNLLQRATIQLISYLSDIFSKTGLALLNLCTNGEVFTLDSISKCIHCHIKADPIQLLEAIDGKLSLKDRFLLDQSVGRLVTLSKANELIRD